MLGDIQNEADITRLVHLFYDKVNRDELLAPVFNDFAKVDWDEHLLKMIAFWKSLLLYTGSYSGSPFPKHQILPIGIEHFDRWLALFEETLNENFKGGQAQIVLNKARAIGMTFKAKMNLLVKE